jgi:hypothetical protein
MSDCHKSKLVTARKDHRCESHRSYPRGDDRGRYHWRPCHIRKGDVYHVESGIDDGEPYRIRTCLFHAAVCAAVRRINRAHCWSFEGINLTWPWSEYIEIGSSEDWRKWLSAIRTEYRKLKGGR